ncbi:DNA translocase FtsK [Paenibacillus brasilensis]|uniref:FtsK gamma domain-containing protein n=2 Tax=Paenibacillus brasilensis TaxID=128574 RepID=A0ABU0L6E1_9BACL|nr:DNA translocase FtsK [Paenibacillus brasilensis]MDQ0496873.1 hypothetical protein [Paenibacillus brasilensis]
MSDIGGDVSAIVTRMASDLSRETAKMTNESVKQMLVFLINKAREQGDKPGEKSLKKLLQSNDEIKMFDIEKRQLKELAEKAKKYEVTYAVIEDEGRHSVFYKQSDEIRVKGIIENLIQKELNPGDQQPKKDLPYEVVGASSIRVPNAVLDMGVEFQRKLAERQGINVSELQLVPHNKDDIATNNEKTQYEVVGQSNIRVPNAVLDVGVGFQRDLAAREGVNVSEITVDQKQPEDERYRQAVDLARQSGEIAIPKLQNELSIGYGEARSLIDRMETEGLVSVYDGSKPQVYIGGQTKEVEPQKAAQDAQIQTDSVPEFLKRREERQAELEVNNTEQEQQGKYERLEGTKIRVSRVTLDMENPEHRQLAESYGIKVNEIDFKRETSDLVIEKEEVKGRESLSEKLGAVGTNRGDDDRTLIVRDLLQRLNTRMSLEDRRQQIKPLVEAQKQAPPVKNKNKERGGR